ncbi:TPA: hypothetical protein HA371_06065 [Candidatus Woesearchaeota archaeon]|nr:hypothetical protein [Candidatus Woesearchaeota archaeon]
MENEEQKQSEKKEEISDTSKRYIFGIKVAVLTAILTALSLGALRGCVNYIDDLVQYRESIGEGVYKNYSVRRDTFHLCTNTHRKRIIIYDKNNRNLYLLSNGLIEDVYLSQKPHTSRSSVDKGWRNIDLSNVPKGNPLENLANISDLEGAWNSATNKPIAKGFWEEEK